MAAEDAAQAEAQAAADAMGADGLLGVGGAGGDVAAAALETEHDFDGREDNPIGADEKYQEGLHEPTSMAQFLKKATRESRPPPPRISRWLLVNPAPA